MSMGLIVQKALQLRSIDEVSIVGEQNSVWRIDVHWLRFSIGAGAGCGISQMSNGHISWEIRNSCPIKEDL